MSQDNSAVSVPAPAPAADAAPAPQEKKKRGGFKKGNKGAPKVDAAADPSAKPKRAGGPGSKAPRVSKTGLHDFAKPALKDLFLTNPNHTGLHTSTKSKKPLTAFCQALNEKLVALEADMVHKAKRKTINPLHVQQVAKVVFPYSVIHQASNGIFERTKEGNKRLLIAAN
jgi:hypothetical protein